MRFKVSLLLAMLTMILTLKAQAFEQAISEFLRKFNQNKLSQIDILIFSGKFKVNEILITLWSESKFSTTVWNQAGLRRMQERKISFSFMLFDDEKNFTAAFKNFEMNLFDVHGFYVIAFTHQAINGSKVSEMLWSKLIYNVVILTKPDPNSREINLATFYPFQENSCQRISSTIINKYINDSWINTNFFPEKLKNFNQCPLTVGTIDDEAAFFQTDLGNGTFAYDGSDVKMLKVIAEVLNFQLKINYSLDWGNIQDNGSASGVLGQVISGDSDMIMGYFMELRRTRFMDYSAAYYFYSFVVVVPLGAPFTSIENLVRPFSLTVWAALIVTFICAVVLIFIFNLQSVKVKSCIFVNNHQNSYYNLLMIILGGSIKTVSKRSFSRLLMMTLVVFCLIMRTVYQSKMFKYLQANDCKKMVKTLDDMKEREFDLYIMSYSNAVLADRLKYPAE